MSNTPVIIASTEAVSRNLYDAALSELAAAQRMAAKYGMSYASASEAIDALGRFAVAHGWDSQADLKEYQEWLETVDDMTGRY
jgi:hypothetical protein